MAATTILNIETALGVLSGKGQAGTVQLGDVTFTGAEVPDVLRVGGQQMLIVRALPGGDRIIDSMGNDPNRLSLSGRFLGPGALGRAKSLEIRRKQGALLTFAATGSSWRVKIRSYAYDYTAKGAVIPYALELEVEAEVTTTAATSTAALSDLIGNDAASALSGVTTALSDVSALAASVGATAQNVIGQVTPIANMIGLGGPLATATNYLTEVQTAAQTGAGLSSAPAALSGAITSLQGAGENLQSLVEKTGANLDTISLTNQASLMALIQNAELHSAAVDAGALVNRATLNGIASTGGNQTGPIVHG